jgi:universal stress protein A
MLRFEKILVPVDFSQTSAKAYAYAAGLCRGTRAALIALYVIPPVHYVETIDLAEMAREAEEAARAALTALKPKPAEAIIRQGVPHDVIVNTAQSLGVDLIVIGTHGHSGLRRLVLGSVAENVVRHAPCPVVTVRSAG